MNLEEQFTITFCTAEGCKEFATEAFTVPAVLAEMETFFGTFLTVECADSRLTSQVYFPQRKEVLHTVEIRGEFHGKGYAIGHKRVEKVG